MNFQQLHQITIDQVVAELPPQLQELMKRHGAALVVAGGFIRALVAGEKPSDIDVWSRTLFLSALGAEQIATDFSSGPAHDSGRAFTVRRAHGIPIQFIHQWVFESPEALLSSFDFTIAQAGVWWDGEKWVGLCAPDFYCDVEAKRLTYLAPTRIEAIAGSLFRVFKFYKRGYSIDLFNLAGVLARATGADPTRINSSLLDAGTRLPAPPKKCEETSDDIGEGVGVAMGGGS